MPEKVDNTLPWSDRILTDNSTRTTRSGNNRRVALVAQWHSTDGEAIEQYAGGYGC